MGILEVYLSLFYECRGRYERALRHGNISEAIKSGEECRSLLLKLAEKNPPMAEKYTAMAREWEASLKRLKEGEKKHTVMEGIQKDAYERQVESLITKSSVGWDDIGGLEDVKRLLSRNVALAVAKKPAAVKPWRGILLFGPPGTGKTLLASAAAGSLNATFFSVKASDVLSKYYGESSRLISALYRVARSRAPSVVFIDEIDSLSQKRGEVQEATRRTLATLLAELDGFQNKGREMAVLTLGATNTPWDLDEAVLSRFPLRVYVPLPDEAAAEEIFRIHLRGLDVSKLDFKALAEESVKRLYSGREIESLCNLALHTMIDDMNPELGSLKEIGELELKLRPLTMDDFEEAFRRIKSPLTGKDIERYEKWAEEFGW